MSTTVARQGTFRWHLLGILGTILVILLATIADSSHSGFFLLPLAALLIQSVFLVRSVRIEFRPQQTSLFVVACGCIALPIYGWMIFDLAKGRWQFVLVFLAGGIFVAVNVYKNIRALTSHN